MKTVISKTIAIAALFCCTTLTGTFAQTATETVTVNDEETASKIKMAQVRLNRIDAKLKQQSGNLNKTYNNVTPAVQEELNNREDSIYLELLSQKRVTELEIKELKKSQQHYVVGKTTTTTTTKPSTTMTDAKKEALLRSGMTSAKNVKGKKK